MDTRTIQGLSSWLKDTFSATALTVHKISILEGGAVQENWSLHVTVQGGPCDGNHRWVLRKQPPSPLIGSWPKDNEFAIIQASHDAGVPVPEPLAVCMDPSIIGAPFLVLEFMAGIAAGRQIVRDPAVDGFGPTLAKQLGSALAKLHSIIPPHDKLAFIPLADETPVRRRIALYRRQLDKLADRHPVLEFVLSWLDRHQPTGQRYTLVHSDFRTGNYLIQGGELVGILDWEIADWGDPREDLGYFCAKCWRFGEVDKEAGGIGSRATFYGAYNRQATHPADITEAPYWEIMGAMRWAIVALLQGHRHLSGEERSLELALTPRMVPEMEFDMLKLIQDRES